MAWGVKEALRLLIDVLEVFGQNEVLSENLGRRQGGAAEWRTRNPEVPGDSPSFGLRGDSGERGGRREADHGQLRESRYASWRRGTAGEEGAANGERDVVRIGRVPGALGPIITETLVRTKDVDMSIQAGEEIGAFLASEIIDGGLIAGDPVAVVRVKLEELGGLAAGFWSWVSHSRRFIGSPFLRSNRAFGFRGWDSCSRGIV